MRKLCLLIFVGFFSLGIAQGPYTLSYNLSQFKFSVENGYNRVKGLEMATTTDIGTPELPVKSLNFILPNGQRVENIEVISINLVPLSGIFDIYPTQPPVPLPEPPPPWVPPDSFIYSQDAIYPDSMPIRVIHHGKFDGIPVATIAIYPLLYNPVRDSLYFVQSITFRFTLEQAPISRRPKIRGERAHQLYKNGIKSSVYNKWQVDAFYTPPQQIVPDEQLLSNMYFEVVIVTTPAMADAYQSLADWLTEKGMPCAIKTTEWIYAHYDGHWDETNYAGLSYEHIGDDAAKIKEFLYRAYYSYGLTFAIIGGVLQPDNPSNSVPFRYCWRYNNYTDPYYIIPADLYFQDFSGYWEVDEDGRIGEPGDDVPDYQEEIYIGRIPAWNYDQALSWVEKRLTYEKSPANRNLMTRSLWITQAAQGMHNFPEYMEETILHFPSQFIQHRVVNHLCNVNDHGLMDTLSMGYGMVSTYGHGSGDTQRSAYPDLRQLIFSFNYQGFPYLHEPYNIDKYYVVYSMGCENAYFDTCTAIVNWTGWTGNTPEACIAEAFTSYYRYNGPSPNGYPPICAAAFLGNTRYGYRSTKDLHQHFLDYLFDVDAHIGNAEAKSKYAYGWMNWYHAYTHNLFGSPEMEVWTQIPEDLYVNHPREIPANTPIDFVVTVWSEQGPVEGALVILYKWPEIYKSKKTESNGCAVFQELTVPSSGIMKVTVTKKNHIPYQGKTEVYEGGGPQTRKTIPQNLVFGLKVFPNIISRNTQLQYTIPQSQKIRLNLYDISGRKINSIADGVIEPGIYTYNLDSSNLSAGIYFLILEGKQETITEKVLIVR